MSEPLQQGLPGLMSDPPQCRLDLLFPFWKAGNFMTLDVQNIHDLFMALFQKLLTDEVQLLHFEFKSKTQKLEAHPSTFFACNLWVECLRQPYSRCLLGRISPPATCTRKRTFAEIINTLPVFLALLCSASGCPSARSSAIASVPQCRRLHCKMKRNAVWSCVRRACRFPSTLQAPAGSTFDV